MPRSFEKATAPVDVKIFDVMGCEDAFKTRLAVYKFEAAGTEEEQAKSFQWGLCKSTLNHLMCEVVVTTTTAATTTLAATTGIPVMGVTREIGVSSPTDLPILCGQTGHLQKDCKKNTTASTSGQADKKPGVSGRVFAITEDHATKTSEHHATIDCHSYRVIFGDIHAPEFIYHGSLPGKSMQIISALQARTLLS
nr:reverse transcriptase domain-containing protein [Tanacetum cinerariifolium]